jgi:hypothetical protein
VEQVFIGTQLTVTGFIDASIIFLRLLPVVLESMNQIVQQVCSAFNFNREFIQNFEKIVFFRNRLFGDGLGLRLAVSTRSR